MALAVAQALLDVLLDFASANIQPSKDSSTSTPTGVVSVADMSSLTNNSESDKTTVEKPVWSVKPLASVELAHSLNLVSSLVSSHAPIKIAVLSLVVNRY